MVQVNLTGPNYQEAVETQDESLIRDKHQEYQSALNSISTLNTLVKGGGEILDKLSSDHFNKALQGEAGEFLQEAAVFEQGQSASELGELDPTGEPMPPNMDEAKKKFDEKFEDLVKAAPWAYRGALRGKKGELRGKYLDAVEDIAIDERDVALSQMRSDTGTTEDTARLVSWKRGIRDIRLRYNAVQEASLEYGTALINEEVDPYVAHGRLDEFIGKANLVANGGTDDVGVHDLTAATEKDLRAYAFARAEGQALSPNGPGTHAVGVLLRKADDAEKSIRAVNAFIPRLDPTDTKAIRFINVAKSAERIHNTSVGGLVTSGDISTVLNSLTDHVDMVIRSGDQRSLDLLLSTVFRDSTNINVNESFGSTLVDLQLGYEREVALLPEGDTRTAIQSMLNSIKSLRGRIIVPATSGKGGGAASTRTVPSEDQIVQAGGIKEYLNGKELPSVTEYPHLWSSLTEKTTSNQRRFLGAVYSHLTSMKGGDTQENFMDLMANINDALGAPNSIMMFENGNLRVLTPLENGAYRDYFSTLQFELIEGTDGRPDSLVLLRGPVIKEEKRAAGTIGANPAGAGTDTNGQPKPDMAQVGAPVEQVIEKAVEAMGTVPNPERASAVDNINRGLIDLAVEAMEEDRRASEGVEPVPVGTTVLATLTLGRLLGKAGGDGRALRLLETMVSQDRGGLVKSGLSILEKMTRNPDPAAIKEFLTNTPLGKKVAANLGEAALETLDFQGGAEKVRKAIKKEMWKSIRGGLKWGRPITTGPFKVLWSMAKGTYGNVLDPVGRGVGSKIAKSAVGKWVGSEFMKHLRNPMTIVKGMWRLVSLPWLAAEQVTLQAAYSAERGVHSFDEREEEQREIIDKRGVDPSGRSDLDVLASIMYEAGATAPGTFGLSTDRLITDSGPYAPQGFDEYMASYAYGIANFVTTGEYNPRAAALGRAGATSAVVKSGSYTEVSDRLFEELYPIKTNAYRTRAEGFNTDVEEMQGLAANLGMLLPYHPGEPDHTEPPESYPEPSGTRLLGTNKRWNEDNTYIVFDRAGDRERFGDKLFEYVTENPGDHEAATLAKEHFSIGGWTQQHVLAFVDMLPQGGVPLHEIFSDENLTDLGKAALEAQLGASPDFKTVAVMLESLFAEEKWDELGDFLEPIVSNPKSHTYFKSLLPPMPENSAMIRIEGLSLNANQELSWKMVPNEQTYHFLVWRTLKERMLETAGVDPVPLDDVERAAAMSSDWIEYQENALTDEHMRGWLDPGEWDEMAQDVATTIEARYGANFDNLNSADGRSPGQVVRDSTDRLKVSARLNAKQDELASSWERSSGEAGHYGDWVTNALKGSHENATLHPSQRGRASKLEVKRTIERLDDIILGMEAAAKMTEADRAGTPGLKDVSFKWHETPLDYTGHGGLPIREAFVTQDTQRAAQGQGHLRFSAMVKNEDGSATRKFISIIKLKRGVEILRRHQRLTYLIEDLDSLNAEAGAK